MYANPIVAWACTFNCEGVTHIGHLVVYWLSPLIGWYFADTVFGEQECTSDCLADEVDTESFTYEKFSGENVLLVDGQ